MLVNSNLAPNFSNGVDSDPHCNVYWTIYGRCEIINFDASVSYKNTEPSKNGSSPLRSSAGDSHGSLENQGSLGNTGVMKNGSKSICRPLSSFRQSLSIGIWPSKREDCMNSAPRESTISTSSSQGLSRFFPFVFRCSSYVALVGSLLQTWKLETVLEYSTTLLYGLFALGSHVDGHCSCYPPIYNMR